MRSCRLNLNPSLKLNLGLNLNLTRQPHPHPFFFAYRWSRTESGINEALMCVKITRGEEVTPVASLPPGLMLIHPIEDFAGLLFKLLDLLIYKFRIGLLGRAPLDSSNPPIALKELFHSYKETYLSGKNRLSNPYFKHFFHNPVVSILWWSQFFLTATKAARRLGR